MTDTTVSEIKSAVQNALTERSSEVHKSCSPKAVEVEAARLLKRHFAQPMTNCNDHMGGIKLCLEKI